MSSKSIVRNIPNFTVVFRVFSVKLSYFLLTFFTFKAFITACILRLLKKQKQL